MREFHGLEKLCATKDRRVHSVDLAQLLISDLAESQLIIYGRNSSEQQLVLAVLELLAEDVQYDSFDQRLDLVFTGEIISDASPALTYCLQGKLFSVAGRCSSIGKVCGVDLYLSQSYTGNIGDVARQKFSIFLKSLQ
jgi:hypothetical protein